MSDFVLLTRGTRLFRDERFNQDTAVELPEPIVAMDIGGAVSNATHLAVKALRLDGTEFDLTGCQIVRGSFTTHRFCTFAQSIEEARAFFSGEILKLIVDELKGNKFRLTFQELAERLGIQEGLIRSVVWHEYNRPTLGAETNGLRYFKDVVSFG